MVNANANVAVIGGGITGSLVGYLSRHLTLNLDLWESDDQLGGRMKSMKCNTIDSYVDVGAQFITTTVETCDNNEIYASLLKSRKIELFSGDIINSKPLPGNVVNYVSPQGMESVVDYFVNSSNLRNIYLSRSAHKLNIGDQFVEITDEKGQTELYDVVVITVPVPVVLNLDGNFKQAIPKQMYEKLQNVKYSCRDCLALFFNESLPVYWSAKYLPDDSVFRYVAIQENKVGLSDSKSSIIFHSSIQFGEKYMNLSNQQTKSTLIEHARRMFPQFPNPIQARHHKWNYSQVLNSYDNADKTTKSVVIHDYPLVIIAGDAFTSSNFAGCIASAESVADILKNYVANKHD